MFSSFSFSRADSIIFIRFYSVSFIAFKKDSFWIFDYLANDSKISFHLFYTSSSINSFKLGFSFNSFDFLLKFSIDKVESFFHFSWYSKIISNFWRISVSNFYTFIKFSSLFNISSLLNLIKFSNYWSIGLAIRFNFPLYSSKLIRKY